MNSKIKLIKKSKTLPKKKLKQNIKLFVAIISNKKLFNKQKKLEKHLMLKKKLKRKKIKLPIMSLLKILL